MLKQGHPASQWGVQIKILMAELDASTETGVQLYCKKKSCFFLCLSGAYRLPASPSAHIIFGSPAPNVAPGMEQMLSKCLWNDKTGERSKAVGLPHSGSLYSTENSFASVWKHGTNLIHRKASPAAPGNLARPAWPARHQPLTCQHGVVDVVSRYLILHFFPPPPFHWGPRVIFVGVLQTRCPRVGIQLFLL